MSAEDNQPDWDKIAEKFDIWLPQLATVGDALLDELDAQNGDHIIDLGSGTGEPGSEYAAAVSFDYPGARPSGTGGTVGQ